MLTPEEFAHLPQKISCLSNYTREEMIKRFELDGRPIDKIDLYYNKEFGVYLSARLKINDSDIDIIHRGLGRAQIGGELTFIDRKTDNHNRLKYLSFEEVLSKIPPSHAKELFYNLDILR